MSYGHLSKLRPTCVGYNHHQKYYIWHYDHLNLKLRQSCSNFWMTKSTKIGTILCVKFGFYNNALTIRVYEISGLTQMNLLMYKKRKRKPYPQSCLPYSDGRNLNHQCLWIDFSVQGSQKCILNKKEWKLNRIRSSRPIVVFKFLKVPFM